MKYLSLIILLCCQFYMANGQSNSVKKDSNNLPPRASFILNNPVQLISLKDVKINEGKHVRILDTVRAHKIVDSAEAIALGGIYPEEKLTVILEKKAFEAFKGKDIDGRRISVSGIIELYNGRCQMYITHPSEVYIIPDH